jgi:hypothetical protein
MGSTGCSFVEQGADNLARLFKLAPALDGK